LIIKHIFFYVDDYEQYLGNDEVYMILMQLCTVHNYPSPSHYFPYFECLYSHPTNNGYKNFDICARLFGIDIGVINSCITSNIGATLYDDHTISISRSVPLLYIQDLLYRVNGYVSSEDILGEVCNIDDNSNFSMFVLGLMGFGLVAFGTIIFIVSKQDPKTWFFQLVRGLYNQFDQEESANEALRNWMRADSIGSMQSDSNSVVGIESFTDSNATEGNDPSSNSDSTISLGDLESTSSN